LKKILVIAPFKPGGDRNRQTFSTALPKKRRAEKEDKSKNEKPVARHDGDGLIHPRKKSWGGQAKAGLNHAGAR